MRFWDSGTRICNFATPVGGMMPTSEKVQNATQHHTRG
jgi:hypothetical protein